jgi:methionyl aminopeptidase
MPIVKTDSEIKLISESCKIVAEVLYRLKSYIRPGVITKELDIIAEDLILSKSAKPAFKGYKTFDSVPYPATLCISVNDEVVHGIPGDRILQEGDIVSLDCGVFKNGYYGDAAVTYSVGVISDDKKKLIEVTEDALYKGIEQAIENNRLSDISYAIQSRVERDGFSVVRDLTGHGIGKQLHEEPAIPNYGRKGLGIKLKKNMTLAIEPMVNMGDYRIKLEQDGWTIKTCDGLPSAHFEHTIVVQSKKAEILTVY